jgi:hypothetical protein
MLKVLPHLSGGKIWCLLLAGTFSLCSVPSSFADSGTSTVLSYTTGTIITPGSPVVAGTRYGRVIRLQYGGSANGTLIATFEAWANNFGIYRSTDDGLTWALIATTTETQFPGWQFKVEPDLFEVPSQMGNLPAGTILLAGNSVNGSGHQLEIYCSLDHGVTWQYRGMVDNNGTSGLGLWEPRLGATSAGQLVCYYSDERFAPTYSQLIGERVSSDGGLTWGAEQYVCAIPDGVQRPGMAVTAMLPNGQYVMSFEAVGTGVGTSYGGPVHIKFSSDGINWGTGPGDYGIAIQTASGAYIGSTPYIMWSPTGGTNGTLIVSAMFLVNSPNTDREFLINTNLGQGNWTMIPSAVQWQGGGSLVAGWSQGMIPTWDGQGIIQLASSSVTINGNPDYNQMLVGREQLILPGQTYTILNQNSGLAIDIPGNTSVHGTGLQQQWTVNGGPAQQWTFNDQGNNVWTVTNPGNQLAWDDYGWGTVVGTIVDQWDYNGLAVQQWKLKPVGNGAWEFINVNSSLAMAVTNASQSPGAGIVLWTNTATPEQNWFPLQPDVALAAYYALDGNTLDSSGNGNDGTPSASATNYIPGRIGTQALQFNGVDVYVQIPRSIGAGNCFTIAFWIKTIQTGNGTVNWWNGAGLVDGKVAGVVTNDFGVSLLNGKIAFDIGNPNTTLQSTVTVNDSQWHHIAVMRNGIDGMMTIYIDGTVNTNKFGPVGPRMASPFLRLGSLQYGGGTGTYYNGALDDVRLYNGWLDTNTIAQLAAMPQMNFPPTLTAISNQTLVAGQTLSVTNSATDPNVPPQVLTWSIQPIVAGLMINTNTGVINWRPTIAQSPATNAFSVIVADNGTPSLSDTQQFTVTVLRPAAPQLTGPQISAGNFSLTISGDAGPDYTVLASTNLSDWTLLLATNPAALPFTLHWPVSSNLLYQFYRVQLGP